MSNLRDIVALTSLIEDSLLESDGEITEAIQQMLSVKDIQLPAKVDSYALVMERMDQIEEFYAEKAKLFAKYSKSAKAAKDRLKENLEYAMNQLNIKELTGNDFKFKAVKNQPKLVIDDERHIPEKYKIISWGLDNQAIKADLKANRLVPGARLESSETIRKFLSSPVKQK